MNRYVVFTAVILMLAAPKMALSQTAPGGGNGGPMGASGKGPGNGSEFQEHKVENLKHIDEHLAEILQRKNCVEAANDRHALIACLPRDEGGNNGGPSGGMQGNPGHN